MHRASISPGPRSELNTSYTLLETLLLCSSLVQYGESPRVWATISKNLLNNSSITSSQTFSPGRLSPDALRERWEDIAREEGFLSQPASPVVSRGQTPSSDGGRRKRTVIEGTGKGLGKGTWQAGEQVARDLTKIFMDRYRNSVVKSIREDEQLIGMLAKDISDLGIRAQDEQREQRLIAQQEVRPTMEISQVVSPTDDVRQIRPNGQVVDEQPILPMSEASSTKQKASIKPITNISVDIANRDSPYHRQDIQILNPDMTTPYTSRSVDVAAPPPIQRTTSGSPGSAPLSRILSNDPYQPPILHPVTQPERTPSISLPHYSEHYIAPSYHDQPHASPYTNTHIHKEQRQSPRILPREPSAHSPYIPQHSPPHHVRSTSGSFQPPTTPRLGSFGSHRGSIPSPTLPMPVREPDPRTNSGSLDALAMAAGARNSDPSSRHYHQPPHVSPPAYHPQHTPPQHIYPTVSDYSSPNNVPRYPQNYSTHSLPPIQNFSPYSQPSHHPPSPQQLRQPPHYQSPQQPTNLYSAPPTHVPNGSQYAKTPHYGSNTSSHTAHNGHPSPYESHPSEQYPPYLIRRPSSPRMSSMHSPSTPRQPLPIHSQYVSSISPHQAPHTGLSFSPVQQYAPQTQHSPVHAYPAREVHQYNPLPLQTPFDIGGPVLPPLKSDSKLAPLYIATPSQNGSRRPISPVRPKPEEISPISSPESSPVLEPTVGLGLNLERSNSNERPFEGAYLKVFGRGEPDEMIEPPVKKTKVQSDQNAATMMTDFAAPDRNIRGKGINGGTGSIRGRRTSAVVMSNVDSMNQTEFGSRIKDEEGSPEMSASQEAYQSQSISKRRTAKDLGEIEQVPEPELYTDLRKRRRQSGRTGQTSKKKRNEVNEVMDTESDAGNEEASEHETVHDSQHDSDHGGKSIDGLTVKTKDIRESSDPNGPYTPKGGGPKAEFPSLNLGGISTPTSVPPAKKFATVAVPLLSNIASHKFANLFATPVSERLAPGYNALIYCPQDLRSIRNSIKAGSALQALGTSTPTPTADGTGASFSTTTPSTPTNSTIASKGTITNSSQLEKELYRMFANACMYNKSTSEIVKETREMYKEVEAWVDNFRHAEKASASRALTATKAATIAWTSKKGRRGSGSTSKGHDARDSVEIEITRSGGRDTMVETDQQEHESRKDRDTTVDSEVPGARKEDKVLRVRRGKGSAPAAVVRKQTEGIESDDNNTDVEDDHDKVRKSRTSTKKSYDKDEEVEEDPEAEEEKDKDEGEDDDEEPAENESNNEVDTPKKSKKSRPPTKVAAQARGRPRGRPPLKNRASANARGASAEDEDDDKSDSKNDNEKYEEVEADTSYAAEEQEQEQEDEEDEEEDDDDEEEEEQEVEERQTTSKPKKTHKGSTGTRETRGRATGRVRGRGRGRVK